MSARWWAFLGWALVAASAVYWGLKLFVAPQPVPAHAAVATTAASPRGDLTRLFGVEVVAAAPVAPVEDTRFELLGVVAPRTAGASREGLALIAVDGQPPRTFRVGAVVEGDLVLRAVSQRGAELGPRQGEATVSLDIPPPEPAATGVPGSTAAGPVPRPPVFRPPARLPGQLPAGAMRAPMPGGVNPPVPQPPLQRVDPQQREPQSEGDDVVTE